MTRPLNHALCALVLAGIAGVGSTLAPMAAGQDDFQEFLPLQDHPADDGLSGDAIYERMLENRFDSYEQQVNLLSGDGSGRTSKVEIRVRYLETRNRGRGIASKTIAKYFAPTDVRHLGYLVINHVSGADDQFVYRPSSRRVRRINVRGEAVAGTDFAFEDIIPQEFEDGGHYRLPDTEVDGRPAYAVAVVARRDTESEYSKFILHLDKERFVPLQTLYWDNKRVKIKRLRVDAASITRFQDVERGQPKVIYVATRSRMDHLKRHTFTELEIVRLTPNPGLRDRDFSQRELTRSR